MDQFYVIDEALKDIADSLRKQVEQQERLLAYHERAEAHNSRLMALRESETAVYLASVPKRQIVLPCPKCGSTERVTQYHSDDGGRDCTRIDGGFLRSPHLHHGCSGCGYETASAPLDYPEAKP